MPGKIVGFQSCRGSGGGSSRLSQNEKDKYMLVAARASRVRVLRAAHTNPLKGGVCCECAPART